MDAPMTRSFKVKLGNGFVELPFDARKQFGKARTPVRVSINGYSYPSTIATYGSKYFVPVRRDRREKAGVFPGDIVEVTITLDSEVRTVEPPPDLSAALASNSCASARWERISYTQKKEYAEAVLGAKKSETRTRRIQAIIRKLTASEKVCKPTFTN